MSKGPLPLKAILAASLVLRAAFAFWLGEKVYQPDEGVYLHLARNILAHGVFGTGDVPAADRPPGLSFLLGMLFHWTGPSLRAGRLLGAAIATASVWLIYRYGTAVFGRRVGLAAAAVAAVYPFFIYWSGILMTESLIVFCVLLAVWRTHEWVSAPQASWVLASWAGLAWGLAIMTRTQNLVFPLMLAPWFLLRGKSGGRLKSAAVFLAVGLAFPAFWAARNKRYLGISTLDAHSGYTLIIRTMFYDEDNIDTGVANQALERTELYRQASSLPPAEGDKFYFRAAMGFIRENPGLYFRHCLGNLWQFWRFYPRLDKTVGVGGAFFGRSRAGFALVSIATEPALLLLALWGLGLAWKERKAVELPLLFIGGTTFIHACVIAQMRYRIVVMPFAILLAVYAAVSYFERRHG